MHTPLPRRRLTSLIETSTLLLCQISTSEGVLVESLPSTTIWIWICLCDYIAYVRILHIAYVYGTNSPLIFASLVRHSLLHFHLSHMAVHHLHHLHYHRLHLLLLAQYFILNLRLGSSANPFLHRPLPFLYRTDSTDSRTI